MGARKRKAKSSDWDLLTPQGVAEFAKAARKYIARIKRSKRLAMRDLVAEGIYTKSGRLTKNYR